eukprot:1907344-Pyramimonas_sp.AAC.1
MPLGPSPRGCVWTACDTGLNPNGVSRFRSVLVFHRSVFHSPLPQNEVETKTAHDIAQQKKRFRSSPAATVGTVESFSSCQAGAT